MARQSGHSEVQPANCQRSASDAEGDETQRVLALSSLLQTPKTNNKELQDFKAKVAADQQELGTLLGQRSRQAEQASVRRRDELTEAILKALQTPNRPLQATPTFSRTNIARNAIFRSVASVCTASADLVGEYDRLNKMIVSMREAESDGKAESWIGDMKKTARLLKIGAETATKNVKKVVGAEVEGGDLEGSTLFEEDADRMDALEKMELNYELNKGLRFANKAVQMMAKCLPEDEDL